MFTDFSLLPSLDEKILSLVADAKRTCVPLDLSPSRQNMFFTSVLRVGGKAGRAAGNSNESTNVDP